MQAWRSFGRRTGGVRLLNVMCWMTYLFVHAMAHRVDRKGKQNQATPTSRYELPDANTGRPRLAFSVHRSGAGMASSSC